MDVIGYDSISSKLYLQIYQLYSIILQQLKLRSDFMSFDGQYEDEYKEYKKLSIQKLLNSKKFHFAVGLAEAYQDYETLIYICEVYN
jgi:hypothetical protein